MRIGIVGDIHEPFAHPMYLAFVRDTFTAWNVDRVHIIGDVVDAHALSRWEHDPNGMSAGDESNLGEQRVKAWHKAFPGASVSIGNHDSRHFSAARAAGIPDRFIRGYADVWNTPTWDWQTSHLLDGVLYTHGTGNSGKDAAINLAVNSRCSVVIGHTHTFAGVKWHANRTSRVFGMNVGCGIDCSAYAMAYAKDFVTRPTLGCGIVLDGQFAYFEPMPCGPGQRYHRSKAKRTKRRKQSA